MDNELRQYLEGMRDDITALTQKEIGSLQIAMKSFAINQISELRDELKAHAKEVARDMETNILHAFHGWARSMEVRVAGAARAVTGFDERLMLIEQRVRELESKLPPAA